MNTIELTADVDQSEQLFHWLGENFDNIEVLWHDRCRIVTDMDFVALTEGIHNQIGEIGVVSLRYANGDTFLIWKPGIQRRCILSDTKGGVKLPGSERTYGRLMEHAVTADGAIVN